MKLHLLSDLHLEFAPFMPPPTPAEVILLAGDIHPGVKAIPWINEVFPAIPVIYVPGNHEYYGQAFPKHLQKFKELTQGTLIHVLDNETLELGGVVFLGCTLWTDFELLGDPRVAGYFATQGMNDFRRIRLSPSYRKLRSLDTAGMHFSSRHWLAGQFELYRGRTIVVVTHHAPSACSLPAGYEDDILSAASASHMDELVERSGACLWLHGHVHISRDYFLGATHVICNPRGYATEPNPEFKPGLIVNIDP